MKQVRLLLPGTILLLLLATPVFAGTFGTAGLLRPGHLALGVEPSFAFSPSTFMLYLHGGLGLTPGADLDVQLGLGSETYFGADVEFGLIRDTRRTPGLSLSVGAHGTSNLGLDGTLLLSNRFSTFSLYGALDMDMEFVNTGTDNSEVLVPLYFNLGVAIPIGRQLDFLLEGDIGLTDVANSGLSGGLMFYF